LERRLFSWPYFLIIFTLLSLVGLGSVWRQSAYAQGSTFLSVLPAQGQLFIDGTNNIAVQVYISNVENLNAFDITLKYDANLISLTHWAHGGFLSNLFCPTPVNTPGTFTLACTQMMRPGVSGSGSLINLIPAQLEHGQISVCCSTTPVTGSLFLQGRAGRAGIPVSLGTGITFGQGPYSTFSMPTQGANLAFGPVVNDSYTLSSAQPGYLNLSQPLTVTGQTLSLPPLRLLAGDVLGDGTVGTADLDAIRAAFGEVGASLASDLNGDGRVDVRDLALAGGNLGLTADEAYAGWLP
jgi:hypothetical protein